MEQKFKSQRPVEITYSTWFGDKQTVTTEAAAFHCWGVRTRKKLDDLKAAFTQETIGVCENNKGKVLLVRPEKIIFLDRKGT